MSERRAPVQADPYASLSKAHPARAAWAAMADREPHPAGTIAWAEHARAWRVYAARFLGVDQSAERIAERHGFTYEELVDFFNGPPKTWQPRGSVTKSEPAAAPGSDHWLARVKLLEDRQRLAEDVLAGHRDALLCPAVLPPTDAEALAAARRAFKRLGPIAGDELLVDAIEHLCAVLANACDLAARGADETASAFVLRVLAESRC